MIDLNGVYYVKILFWDKPDRIDDFPWSLTLQGEMIRCGENEYKDGGHVKFDDSTFVLTRQNCINFFRGDCWSRGDEVHDVYENNDVFISEFIDVGGYNSASFYLNSDVIRMHMTLFDSDHHIIKGSTVDYFKPDNPNPAEVSLRRARYIRLVFWIQDVHLGHNPNVLSWKVTLKKGR